MPLSPPEFRKALSRIGLMPLDEFDDLVEDLSADDEIDSEKLISRLIEQNRLTAFQARQIHGGMSDSLILGDYILVNRLGHGNTNRVYEARDIHTGKVAALKVFSADLATDQTAMQLFRREVRAAARLQHPNIVTAISAEEIAGQAVLVMPYFEGTDLAAHIAESGAMEVEPSVSLLLQTALGLEYAHSRGIIHRDIKPSNLLMTTDGSLRILDLGIAQVSSNNSLLAAATNSQVVMGTVDFMAPEQARDSHTADVRADIYSLGMTLWFLLTGRVAFPGDTFYSKLFAHQKAERPSLQEACSAASNDLEAVFQRMTARSASDRYPDMASVIVDLQQVLDGTPAVVRSLDTTVTPDKEQTSNQKAWMPIVSGVGLLSVVAFTFWPRDQAMQDEVQPDTDAAPQVETSDLRAGDLVSMTPQQSFASARRRQASQAEALGLPIHRKVALGGEQFLSLSLIPSGEFLTGSSEAERDALISQLDKPPPAWLQTILDDELPRQAVRVARPFWMGRHEVTLGQFRRFVEATQYRTDAETDGHGGYGYTNGHWKQAPQFIWSQSPGYDYEENQPVINVSYDDGVAFSRWLNTLVDAEMHFEMPSEIQWEYACRADTVGDWHFGTDQSRLVAHACFEGSSRFCTTEVGRFQPNAFGLFDMYGNVSEWCDRRGPVRSRNLLADTQPPEVRIHRGGRYNGSYLECRSAFRSSKLTNGRLDNIGFRVVASIR